MLVIRTAGEVLDRAVLGSIEFGVLELQIPLIMVLGHKNCGAVKTAIEMLHQHKKAKADIGYLVESLALAVEIGDTLGGDKLDQTVRAQIASVVVQLKKLLAFTTMMEQGKLKIVGGYYDLDSGLVDIIVE